MDADNTPDLVLTKAIAAKLGNIHGLNVQTKPGTPNSRSMARVYPYRSSFLNLSPDDPFSAAIEEQQGFLQVETMQFEIGLMAVDLSYQGLVAIAQNEVVKALTGFQPYHGILGDTSHAISPFYVAGAVRSQAIRTQKTPVYERVLMVECKMKRYNGLPPRLVPNIRETLDHSCAVDIFGYQPWELV